jgi:hypothetical protein
MRCEEINVSFNILTLCTPEPGEPVIEAGLAARIYGRPGLFFIVHVDYERQTADLISAHGISPVLRQVPFTAMRAIDSLILQSDGSDLLQSC